MQVFGLPGHVIKNGRAASRLLAAQTPDIEAARRRDAVHRRYDRQRRPDFQYCLADPSALRPLPYGGRRSAPRGIRNPVSSR